jgi:hypothetical protein
MMCLHDGGWLVKLLKFFFKGLFVFLQQATTENDAVMR